MRFETLPMRFNGSEMRRKCQCVSTEAKCVANPFKKHFQNVVNALANNDNAFNKTAAGCLESFTEPLLLDTMKSLLRIVIC